MNVSNFVSLTTWSAILLIAAGLLVRFLDNNFTSWFFFGFFCFVGLVKYSMDRKAAA